MVLHGGTCYVLTPRHVTGTRRVATIKTATPMRSATASMEAPFWDGMDLAIGTVRAEALDGACRLPLGQLDQSLSVDAGQAMHLSRLRDSGEVERVPLDFVDARYLTFSAIMSRADESFFRGTSGAVAYVGERPMGMVITTSDGREGQFIRIEEIYLNVARWVNRSVRFGTPAPALAAPAAGEGMRIVLQSVSQPPISSEHVPENMLSEGAYIFAAGRNQIIFRLPGATPTALSRIEMRSDPDAGYALPRQIRVEVSTAADHGSGWRNFATADMAPDGVLLVNRSAQLARWVRLTVESAQDLGPVGIARVSMQ